MNIFSYSTCFLFIFASKTLTETYSNITLSPIVIYYLFWAIKFTTLRCVNYYGVWGGKSGMLLFQIFRFRFLHLRHFLFPYAIHLYLYTLRWMQRHLWFGLYHKRFCLFKKYFKLFFVKYTGYCSSTLSSSLIFVLMYILLSRDNINVNGNPTADSMLA